MQPVSLALFWHQHQPYYPDDVSGETLMPWVRLHGTKDYIGMALHIQEVPEFHCTINLVPSLLAQIQRYVDGGSDRHLDVSRMPADSLAEDDATYLLDHFFMANEQSMIRPYDRYYELFQERALGRDPATTALKRFSARDFRDLQVWNNLTWFHEILFEQDSELRKFREKGRHWTEKEKLWLLERQREVVSRIVPLHRELMEGGQVELTTTPFFHPILPLLWDKRSAREAMPGCGLPKHLESYPEDARWQLDSAVRYHEECFGLPPRGLWPSEGSVSQAVINAVADAGIEWIATDEEILTHSTEGFVHRDGHGLVNRPELLYRPWRVEQDGQSLQIIFRDHGLSDLIGFHYQRNDPQWAANDLLSKVKEIGRAVARHTQETPALVPIILDGENCWEYYTDGGVRFLRNLYQQAVREELVHPVRVSEYLAKAPATHKIGKLFAGSWINHDFYIWIGHQEDRDAWDLVHMTREFLTRTQKSKTVSRQAVQQAWNELFIAEGSDWYWWFGDDHNSAQDDLFDDLFRRHLRNVYTLLGESPPLVLFTPVTRVERRHIHTYPRAFLRVHVDGRNSYFEWLYAGHYQTGSERGTMTLVTESVIRDIYFGFDRKNLYIRVDTPHHALVDLDDFDEVRIRCLEPFGLEIRLRAPFSAECTPEIAINGDPVQTGGVAMANQILELAIPWNALDLETGDGVSFAVELASKGEIVERTPSEGAIDLTVPAPDFEMRHWQA